MKCNNDHLSCELWRAWCVLPFEFLLKLHTSVPILLISRTFGEFHYGSYPKLCWTTPSLPYDSYDSTCFGPLYMFAKYSSHHLLLRSWRTIIVITIIAVFPSLVATFHVSALQKEAKFPPEERNFRALRFKLSLVGSRYDPLWFPQTIIIWRHHWLQTYNLL